MDIFTLVEQSVVETANALAPQIMMPDAINHHVAGDVILQAGQRRHA